MQVYENIFFVENGFVTVYRFLKNQKKFEYLKQDGQKKYPLTGDFWKEWRRASDYVEDMDMADFCFIYDEENTLIHDPFLDKVKSPEGGSCWSMQAIRNFFDETVSNTHVELYLPSGKAVQFKKESQMFGGAINSRKIFYTNLELAEPETQRSREETGEEGISPFALYFKELIQREKEV